MLLLHDIWLFKARSFFYTDLFKFQIYNIILKNSINNTITTIHKITLQLVTKESGIKEKFIMHRSLTNAQQSKNGTKSLYYYNPS